MKNSISKLRQINNKHHHSYDKKKTHKNNIQYPIK